MLGSFRSTFIGASAPVDAVAGAVEATGGNIGYFYSSGNWYKSHTFLSNGTFTVTTGGNVNFLLVGGGGGGGASDGGFTCGGGGGGAQVRVFSDEAVTAQGYSLTIGAGGGSAANGSSSTGLGYTSEGGGFGGGAAGSPASRTDAAGGGGRGHWQGTNMSGGTGTFAGGNGATGPELGGGGGGNGAVGSNAGSGAGGAGGNGVGTALFADSTEYFGGGGGGSCMFSSSTPGAGTHGGGTGGDGNTGGSATANTGSGGGGAGGNNKSGGSGASGIAKFSYTFTAGTLRSDSYASSVELAVPFDDAPGGLGVIDRSVELNTSVTGSKTVTQGASSSIQGTTYKWTSPDYEGALENDRSGQALTYNLSANGGTSIPASGSGTFVVEGWFNAQNSGTNQNWCLSSADSGGRWLFGINSGSTFSFGGENNIGIGSGWHHLAIVCDGGTKRFYYDGIYKGAWYSTNTGFSTLHVGQFNAGDGNDYIGFIQDLRVTVGSNRAYTGTNSGSANFTLPNSIVESYS